MCSVTRAVEGIATGGLSETVRGGLQVAKGDVTGGLMGMATLGGAGAASGAMAPKIPNMPALPNMSTDTPAAPPPPAPTAGGTTATASPFSLSIRPRRSQSLRTDKSNGGDMTGLNIPT